MAYRNEKLKELCQHLAADFLVRESGGQSLLTVTGARLSDDGKYATIFFTVFPSEKESFALEFTKRKRAEFRAYVESHSRIGHVPFFDFAIDQGEKNRQKIDALENEDKARNDS